MRFACALALTLVATSAHAGWYKVGVVKADIAPTHDGKPWDRPGEAQPTLKSCCHPPQGDGTGPDVQVILRLGDRAFETRVRSDELHPAWRDFAFLRRAGNEPLILEVWDVDANGRDLIGRAELAFDARGHLIAPVSRFGAVESIELYAEPVTEPRVSTGVDASEGGEIDTHLEVVAGQTLRALAEGKMCVSKRCIHPDADAGKLSSPGRLTLFFGDDDHPVTELYAKGLERRAPSTGFVRLFVPPPIDGSFSGRYSIVLSVEE